MTAPCIILDIGCGTGVVTRHLRSRSPRSAHLRHRNRSPVPAQPSRTTNPRRICPFIQREFPNPPSAGTRASGLDPRTFVYSRLLLCGMTDWPGYVRDVWELLQLGCWAEMGDSVEDCFYADDRSVVLREEWEWLRWLRAGGATPRP